MFFGLRNIFIADDKTCRLILAEQRWQYTGSDAATVSDSVRSLVVFRLAATHLNCRGIGNKVATGIVLHG